MIKRVEAIAKFLQAARNLSKQGISKDQVIEFAKREFGEVSDLLKRQIEQIFTPKSGGITSIKKPEGKVIKGDFDQASGTSIDQEDFLRRIGKQIEEDRKTLGPIGKEKKEGIGSLRGNETFDELLEMEKKSESSPLMKRLEEGVKSLRKVEQGENLTTGLTRTMAREILMNKGIKIAKGMDPIELFRKKFGQDGDVSNLADELIEMERMGTPTKNLNVILKQEGLLDLKMPKEPPQGYTDEELAEIQKAIDEEDILLKFDPEDRKPNADGGLNYLMGL